MDVKCPDFSGGTVFAWCKSPWSVFAWLLVLLSFILQKWFCISEDGDTRELPADVCATRPLSSPLNLAQSLQRETGNLLENSCNLLSHGK